MHKLSILQEYIKNAIINLYKFEIQIWLDKYYFP